MKAWFPKIFLSLAFIALAGTAFYLATAGKFSAANETLWTTGKIFVVICVLTLIFFGITAFLLHLEQRITRIEGEVNKNTRK